MEGARFITVLNITLGAVIHVVIIRSLSRIGITNQRAIRDIGRFSGTFSFAVRHVALCFLSFCNAVKAEHAKH